MSNIICQADLGYTVIGEDTYNDYGVTVSERDRDTLWIETVRYNDGMIELGYVDISELSEFETQAEVAIDFAVELIDRMETGFPRVFGVHHVYAPLCRALSVYQAIRDR